MRVMDHVSATFDFVKNRFLDTLLVGLEGYLFNMAVGAVISLVLMLTFLPLGLIVFFVVAGKGSPVFILLIILFTILFSVVIMLLGIAFSSMMIGGLTHSMIRVRSGLKHNFGEVFRFGWAKKWDLIRINVINSLLVMMIVIPAVLVLSLVGTVLSIFLPFIGVCLFLMIYLAMVPLFSSLVAVAYLPFIIWIKEGTGHWASIKKAWKIYFDHFWSFVGFGLIVGLVNMVGSMLPLINILTMMIMGPSIIVALVFIYEELYPQSVRRSTHGPYPPNEHGFVKY
ncbi:MAG: hypothetical protein ACMUHB_00615 [Thermoplasmatota archaeon]